MVNKGQIVGINWNRIPRLHSHVLAHMNSVTVSRRHIKAYQDASNQPRKCCSTKSSSTVKLSSLTAFIAAQNNFRAVEVHTYDLSDSITLSPVTDTRLGD